MTAVRHLVGDEQPHTLQLAISGYTEALVPAGRSREGRAEIKGAEGRRSMRTVRCEREGMRHLIRALADR